MRIALAELPRLNVTTTYLFTLAFMLIFTLTIAPSIAFAECAVRAGEAYIPQPPPGAGVAAAYLTLTNDCDSPAVLIGVEAAKDEGALTVSLHQSSAVDGIARMTPVNRIPMSAGSSVTFAPGGLHVMLHGRELKAGETIQFQLLLEDGDRIPVRADVVPGTSRNHRSHEIRGSRRSHTDHDEQLPGGVE